MRGTLVLAGLLLATALAPAPATAEEGITNPSTATPTTLYFHLLDGQNDFPINTQPPRDDWKVTAGIGLATHSTSCLPAVDGAPLASKAWHTWYGYSSPSLVEYDFLEDGRPRVHPERGFSYEVILDTATQPVLYWYLETQNGAGPGGEAPLVAPGVVVQATMRTGSAIGIGDENYEAGEVLASGRTDPSILAAEATQGPARYIPGTRPVYEFAVPLDVQSDRLPEDTGYNVRIDVWMDNPACSDDGYLMPNVVRLHSGPGTRPRMELATRNPLQIEYMHPQWVGDMLVVHAAANSPWGSYDVDEADLELVVEGPSQPQELGVVISTFIHQHGPRSHFQPMNASYSWDFVEEGGRPGPYTFTWTVRNDQHTAEARATSTFEVGSAEPEAEASVPAAGPLPVLAGLVALAALGGAGGRRPGSPGGRVPPAP